jgi:Flp pilus assembly pilin Flp
LIINPGQLTKRYFKNRFSRIASDNSGAVAVEFAMLMIPFLTILMAMIETGYMLFVSILMEGATSDAARQVRTGNVQRAQAPLASFQETLCDGMFGIVNCDDLTFEVKGFGNTDNSAGGFAPGAAGDIIVVSVSFQFSFITPFLADLLRGGNGSVLLVSSSAFRNEPFGNALN